MGYNCVVSGYTISIGFRLLMGVQQTPRFWGVTHYLVDMEVAEFSNI